MLDELNGSLSIPYNKTKEEVWKALNKNIKSNPVKTRRLNYRKVRMVWAAAMIALLVGFGLFLRFYHYTVAAKSGQIANFFLPDGSEVILSSESEAAYYPLWWAYSRKVTLKGEAFFKVQKGKKFSVKSARGITTVVGTSFDIYARADNYKVVCYTGKVSVKARESKQKIILTPGEKAEINTRGEIAFSKEKVTNQAISWINNQFVFTSEPLPSVFDEMARRYNVKIKMDEPFEEKYTGNFSTNMPVEQALSIVCKPFGLTFTKQEGRLYVIKK